MITRRLGCQQLWALGAAVSGSRGQCTFARECSGRFLPPRLPPYAKHLSWHRDTSSFPIPPSLIASFAPSFLFLSVPREDAEAAAKAAAIDAEMANDDNGEKKAMEEDVKALSKTERWLEWYKGTWMGKTKWSQGTVIYQRKRLG